MTKRTLQTFIVGDLVGKTITLKGRDAWALSELIRTGEKGCTPIDTPGPRWSAYVHKLRHEYGLKIDTVHENHGGAFPGCHARYVLRTQVRIIEDERRVA